MRGKVFSPIFYFFYLKTRSQVRHACKIQTLCTEMWTFLYSFYVTIRIRLNRTFVGQWPSKLYPFFKRYRFLVFMCASKLRMFDIFGICISKKLFFITLLSELPGFDQVIRSYSRRKSIYKFGLSVSLFVCVQ